MSKPGPLRQRFSRRSLLRGLGAGAALLAPLARQRASIAQQAPAGNLIIFYTPNGHKRSLLVNNQRTPAFDATSTAGSLTLGSALTPLQPFLNDVAVIKGLNLKTPTFIASHQDVCRILTCWSAPREGNDQTQFTAYGPSIDQVAGAAFNERPLVLAVDPFRVAPMWRTLLSWSASGVNLPVSNVPFTKDHQQVFTDLFGGLTDAGGKGDQLAALARLRARNGSVLDLAGPDLARLRARLGSNDRTHLDLWMGALRSVEKRAGWKPWLPPVCAPNGLETRINGLTVPAPVQNDDKSAPGLAGELQARGELWMDMIATAFACGTRRVAVIQWQGASEGYDPVANLGSPTHHSVQEGAAPPEHWAAIDAWYASRFAYQLAALKKLGILDRTIVVWVSEVTEGENQLNMVTVVAGGQTLGMKMGQYIQYPFNGQELEGSQAIPVAQDPANRSLSDLWATVQQALGINKPTFGDPKWCAGPLAELRG
jgi:hypothetical protein